MQSDDLETIEINPAGEVRGTLIWLHGLGADGHDFEPLIPQLDLVDRLGVRVILPHAHRRPVTINGGMVMRAWYDIVAQNIGARQDADGILQSEQAILQLVSREIERGVPVNRIALAGFSQGGAIVLHTGLRLQQSLAGILALSCYLPLAERFPGEASTESRATPILMCHGLEDSVIPIALAEASRNSLLDAGYTLEWRSYPMPHAVCPEEIRDVAGWLSGIFAPSSE